MRHFLVMPFLFTLSVAHAEIRELEGEEMVDTYVEGISIGQLSADTAFPEDDRELREASADHQALLPDGVPEIAIEGSPTPPDPQLNDLISGIENPDTRLLAERALLNTGDRTRLVFDVGQAASAAGVTLPLTPASFNGDMLNLMPSATGYQLEFSRNR